MGGRLQAVCILVVTILLAADGGPGRAAEGWTAFRGPDGRGYSQSGEAPLRWSETENIRWKTPLHGKGWSSPVVWGGQVWLTTATEDGRSLYGLGLDARTGRVLHDLLVFENEDPQYCHPTNSYASPTPVIEDGRVYLHFGTYGTACIDTENGSTLWTRRDLNCDHFRGPGSSPVVHGDLLVASYDGFDRQFVVALDKQTGRTVWQQERDIDYGTDNGDHKKAYSTPLVIGRGGREQLISPAAVATIAYDLRSGAEAWRVTHGGMNAAARPLSGQGLVFIAAGDGKTQLVAVRPGGAGDVTDSHVVWSSGQGVPRRGTPLLLGERLFMIDDSGVASCVEARTGRVVWRKRLEGAYWASPIAAGGRIYFFSQDGRCPVVAGADRFELLADNTLDAGMNATPAIADGALLVRTFTHLYRIEQR